MTTEETNTGLTTGQADDMRLGKVLSFKATREILGCGTTWLYEKINKGEIEARKQGRNTVFLQEEVERYRRSLPIIVPKHPIQKTAA